MNAVGSIVNLSLANVNKVKIVRSRMVPILVDLLRLDLRSLRSMLQVAFSV